MRVIRAQSSYSRRRGEILAFELREVGVIRASSSVRVRVIRAQATQLSVLGRAGDPVLRALEFVIVCAADGQEVLSWECSSSSSSAPTFPACWKQHYPVFVQIEPEFVPQVLLPLA